jgi:hypothetical protein
MRRVVMFSQSVLQACFNFSSSHSLGKIRHRGKHYMYTARTACPFRQVVLLDRLKMRLRVFRIVMGKSGNS